MSRTIKAVPKDADFMGNLQVKPCLPLLTQREDMKIDNEDIEIIKHDIKQLTAALQINGTISGNKKTQVISTIGKECADKIVEGMFAQLSAFDKENGDKP